MKSPRMEAERNREPDGRENVSSEEIRRFFKTAGESVRAENSLIWRGKPDTAENEPGKRMKAISIGTNEKEALRIGDFRKAV